MAWIRLNNPKQYNSYTTEMVKGVIAGFSAARQDRSVVAAVFTGTGDRAFLHRWKHQRIRGVLFQETA